MKSLLSLGVLAVLGAACVREAPARPQIVVVLDTDAPVPGQLGAGDLSAEAAVDTVRVDVLDGRGGAVDFRDFTVVDPRDWPVSFGTASSVSGGSLHLRIRAFRGRDAARGELGGVTTLEPVRELTIDRAVDITMPTDGVSFVRITLSADCLGVPPSFVTPVHTCIDASRRSALATEGVELLSELPTTSRVGTWPGAVATPCGAVAGPDQVCIPGGFGVLGDLRLSGFEDGSHLPSVPVRPYVVSPFLMDRREMTVGRFRSLARAGKVKTLPRLRGDGTLVGGEYCTWLGVDDPSNDGLPLNCVPSAAAVEACSALGGRLPTEAEWEHAASGRGERRMYAWGDPAPSCCSSSFSRRSSGSATTVCAGTGPEPTGSHSDLAACGGRVDVSRDGVFDLSGSVRELTSDVARGFDHACWGSAGVLMDPQCIDTSVSLWVTRGGDWSAGATNLLTALRMTSAITPVDGFRCVYGGR